MLDEIDYHHIYITVLRKFDSGNYLWIVVCFKVKINAKVTLDIKLDKISEFYQTFNNNYNNNNLFQTIYRPYSNHRVTLSTPRYCQSATFGRLTFCVYPLFFLRKKDFRCSFRVVATPTAPTPRPPRAPLPNRRHHFFVLRWFDRLRSPRVPVLVTHPRVRVKSTVLWDYRVWVTKIVARVRGKQLSQSDFSFAAGVSQFSQSKLRYSTGVDRTTACVFAHCA